ncbi:MAG: hypothetical protein QNJ03_04655 [Dinoroseobacter sp.]|nr:hypothetical protein [Dinoroseobacter sp.]
MTHTLKLLALLLSFLPISATAQMAERSLSVEINAVVESVDRETREMLLRDPETGASELVIATPELKNFDQIEPGDKVRAEATLGISARLALAGEEDSAGRVEARTEEGEKPGALRAETQTFVLELVSYNPETFVAVMRNAEGVLRQIFVESEVGREFAASVEPGDRVAITLTETKVMGIVEE